MIYSKDYITVYNKIMSMFPDLESTFPSVYLALQCAKLYQQAFSMSEMRESLYESTYMDEPLGEMIKLIQSIEERISKLETNYYELDNYVDDCQLSPYEWKRLSEELIGLLCLSDSNKIEQFDRLYDFRKNIWFGVSKVLNGM
ncbi:hypothetical protein RF11_02327 [Thelohanellus kitauei]|uniref:Uncharacterized protein n=1 Tax=Thelohanellus kitauei TaxID=669202 RepID=A0A0C2JF40_THEKT|nr:hypothetical protein RF11_02327 [Thelohanellus kitauei]